MKTATTIELLTPHDLPALLETRADPCVSLILPLERTGRDTQQNPVRLRNMLRTAAQALCARGMAPDAAQEFLLPARALVMERAFWEHPDSTRALFLGPQSLRCYRLPCAAAAAVVVGTRFAIRPLLPVLAGSGRFFILALSLNRVRLLESEHCHVRERTLPPDVPTSLAAALAGELFEPERRFYTGVPSWTPGRTGAVFYGQGDGGELAKQKAIRYLRKLDAGVRGALHEEHAPLVLAGVAFLLALYREVSQYAHIAPAGITGNPDDLSAEHLQAAATIVLQPLIAQAAQDAMARYRQLAGTGRTATDIREIIATARAGRIDTLLIAGDAPQWGTVDPATGRVTPHPSAGPADSDLVDVAAAETLRHDGHVYVTAPAGGRDPELLAAILRY